MRPSRLSEIPDSGTDLRAAALDEQNVCGSDDHGQEFWPRSSIRFVAACWFGYLTGDESADPLEQTGCYRPVHRDLPMTKNKLRLGRSARGFRSRHIARRAQRFRTAAASSHSTTGVSPSSGRITASKAPSDTG